MGDPLYIKTYIMNLYFAGLALASMVYLAYNMYFLRPNTSRLSVISVGFFPIMFVAGICDNIFDLSVGYSPNHFTDTGLMVMLCVVLISAIFSCAYLVCFHTFCRGLFLKESKTEKMNTAASNEIADMAPLLGSEGIYENMDDDDDDALSSASTWVKHWPNPSPSSELEPFKSLIERYINVNLSLNLVWALGCYNMSLAMMYVVRLISYTQTNMVRDTDVVLAALAILALTIPVVVYDWFKFRVYTGPIFMSYVTFAVVLFSDFLDFYGFVGAVNMLTLAIIIGEIGLMTYKITAYSHSGHIPYYKCE